MPKYQIDSREHQQYLLDKSDRENERRYQEGREKAKAERESEKQRIKEQAAERFSQMVDDNRRWAEEREEYDRQEAIKEKAFVEKQIKEAKAGNLEIIDVEKLYNDAISYRENGQKKDAALNFWKSFICGKKAAAYDLFYAFYYGDGVFRNIDLGKAFFKASYNIGDARTEKHLENEMRGAISHTASALGGELATPCHRVHREFENIVTPELYDLLLKKVTYETGRYCSNLFIAKRVNFSVDLDHNTLKDYIVATKPVENGWGESAALFVYGKGKFYEAWDGHFYAKVDNPKWTENHSPAQKYYLYPNGQYVPMSREDEIEMHHKQTMKEKYHPNDDACCLIM